MDLEFPDEGLRRLCEQQRRAVRKLGTPCARKLRRRLADERDVPAYVIFSDVSLREMARSYPTRLGDFGRIPGVGQQKLNAFGETFVGEINQFLLTLTHPRREFASPEPLAERRLPLET